MICRLKTLSSTILVLVLINTLAPGLPAWAGAAGSKTPGSSPGKPPGKPPGKLPGTAAKTLSTNTTRPIKDKWAVIIGIDKFKDQSIPQLQYPAKDAADFADFLVSKGNFARDHVLLLTNENATRDKIRDAIGGNWLPRRVDEDDLVLIYASTHGSPKELDVAGENFLVAYDSDPQNLYVTGIRFSDLAPEIKERTGCDRVVLLLDACNSGAASVGGGGGGKDLVRTANFDVAALAGEGQIVISSSASNQRSYESKRYQNGVFTKQLINALERNPQKATLSEAFNYLKEQVENEVRFDRKLEQTPVMRSKWSGGELILLAVPARPRHIDSEEHASTMSATGTSRASAGGPADSIYQRAQQLFDQKRYEECGPLALQAAEAGHAGGQYLCGMLCDKGLGQPRDAAKAAQWWKKSAEQGFAEGECWYGNVFRRGEVVPANPGKAVEWYQKAADQGNAHGQYLMGRMYMEGTGVPQNYSKAYEWYQKAADQGYIDGQTNVGYLYEKGNGVPQNYGKAAEWYQKAADQGSANAQGKLGGLYEDGNGVPQNLEKALQWYQKAAENGDRWAQGQLGALYEAGKGIPKNYEKAALWYQKAADQGSDWAQCQLGKLYAAGNGVPQNYQRAVEWYRKAAAQGSRTGYFYLAVMYFGGNGVPQNNEEAARLYLKAAEMGEPMAQNNLGHMYEKGLGMAQDYSKAIMWFQKSADQGNILAMNNLALFYINGWGVPRDLNKARSLLSAAAARGDTKASQALQRLNQN